MNRCPASILADQVGNFEAYGSIGYPNPQVMMDHLANSMSRIQRKMRTKIRQGYKKSGTTPI